MSSAPRTIQEAAQALRAGTTTSVALTQSAIARADAVDGRIGSYITRFDDRALAAAEQADADLAAGRDRGPLQGIPVAVKDIISTEDGPTTGQSLILDPTWGDQGDAPAVARLRAAGAVICGKTTTLEFACGMPDPTKPFPIPRHPIDPSRWPGGSSSGSANGVAAGLFLGALGTDTGGSVRWPASYCGVTGHKPTFGLVPTSGCKRLDSSLDVIGPLARSAWDAAAMLRSIAGPDPSDLSSAAVALRDPLAALDGSLDGVRVGVDLRSTIHRPMVAPLVDPLVEPAIRSALDVLAAAGATVVDVEVPLFTEVADAVLLAFAAEAFTYHRRDLQSRWDDYGFATRAALVTGAMLSAPDFLRLQRLRQFGRERMTACFEELDVVVTPTTATGAPMLEGLDPSTLLLQAFTPAWSGVGFPAASVPMGTDADGLPLGMQIAGRPFEDGLVLKVADAFQRRTSWHLWPTDEEGDR